MSGLLALAGSALASRPGSRAGAAADPPRLRAAAGEPVLRDDLRRELCGALSGAHAGGQGRTAHAVLRYRALRASTTTSRCISGQAPNDETQLDCPMFSEFRASAAGPRRERPAARQPAASTRASVRTLPDQLEAAGLTWKAYMEDMGNNPAREPATCGARAGRCSGDHRRRRRSATSTPPSTTRSCTSTPSSMTRRRCDAHVVNLTHLPQDLGSAATHRQLRLHHPEPVQRRPR